MGDGLRDQFKEAKYDLASWSQSIAWMAVVGGIGRILTGWSEHDSDKFASGVAIVFVALYPRAKMEWAYEFARTVTMRLKWTKVPEEEKPLRTPDEILSKPHRRKT
jgi:hypothetical protein